MSWYKTGSVTATNGSKIITGNGTQFSNPLNGVSTGRMLLLPGAGTVQIYEIESVQSDTQLTLVSAFSGITGGDKLYAVPTSPTVSIEQFAHEFASTLAYYQQQLQGWQSILTGSGNITLTTPDGQSVTIRSQSEWDRLLNTKMGAGQFGWGGKAVAIPPNTNLFDYFTVNTPSGLYWADSTAINKPPGFADTVLYWSPIFHPEFYASLVAVNFTTGGAKTASISVQRGNWETSWSVDWNSRNLISLNGFVKNALATDYPTGGDYAAALQSEQAAGSCTVGGIWKAYLSVRHRGGKPDTDSTQWGWGLVDGNMTQGNFNEFVLEKTVNGNFLPAVHLKHTGNTMTDSNGFLKTASPVVKLFSDGSSELNTESEGIVTERSGTGQYRISGCLGLNADLAWGGMDGGIAGPRCRNGLERLWIDYDVEQDGSIIIRTYHRTHPSAMNFARNEIDSYVEGDLIDIPTDTFLSVRVQMPDREETPYESIIKPA
ncbi:hypothetical protein [Pectobacterium zantedeschiae]|uniref:Phage tail protein C-terminal domain-containing protein n=1 Tax=Pectobacterium zantedeschiae TaxID=2034769 RepID=A0A9X8P5R0_9GAMM|nr:hypothetical protein [Pectobacterium zantedeschiae]RYC44590.1 hypothetical protein CLR69_06100 [Pectobacterium zantedeschiae]RYC49748.1 hypothetical protein CTN06_01900 [Pectobacterium zantedeschiae]